MPSKTTEAQNGISKEELQNLQRQLASLSHTIIEKDRTYTAQLDNLNNQLLQKDLVIAQLTSQLTATKATPINVIAPPPPPTFLNKAPIASAPAPKINKSTQEEPRLLTQSASVLEEVRARAGGGLKPSKRTNDSIPPETKIDWETKSIDSLKRLLYGKEELRKTTQRALSNETNAAKKKTLLKKLLVSIMKLVT